MYADDTVIYTHAKNAQLVAAKLTGAMDKVAQWLNESCLTLNVGKTAAMYFSHKHKSCCYLDVRVSGEIIKNVTEYKYFGITLDPTLNFKKHIKQMSQSLKYNLLTV